MVDVVVLATAEAITLVKLVAATTATPPASAVVVRIAAEAL